MELARRRPHSENSAGLSCLAFHVTHHDGLISIPDHHRGQYGCGSIFAHRYSPWRRDGSWDEGLVWIERMGSNRAFANLIQPVKCLIVD